MAIVRVPKVGNYTIMSNYHLRDKNLGLSARGLMCWMLSCPDNWDFTVTGMVKLLKEGKDAINTALRELEKYGYVERRRTRDAKGVFKGIEYIIHEEPKAENPQVDNPLMENPQQIITKLNNNYIKEGKKESRKSFNDIIDCNFKNTEIRELLRAFLQLRFAKGKTTIDKSLQLLLDKLKKMSKNNDDIAIKIIKQSLEKGWTDFYELKDKKTNKPTEKKKVKTNQFNNFHQREYTKEEMNNLELRLLKQ